MSNEDIVVLIYCGRFVTVLPQAESLDFIVDGTSIRRPSWRRHAAQWGSLLFPLFSALTLPAAFYKPDLMAYCLTVYHMNQCE